MLNYNNLINDIDMNKKPDEYLLGFFTKENYRNYEVSELANDTEIKAIKTLFESKKPIDERIENVLRIDPFCIEAIFAYVMISENVFIEMRFRAYFDEAKDFGRFNEYQKRNYIELLNLYVDFLFDISNITRAIVVLRMIVRLTNEFSLKNTEKFAFAYFCLENADDFYRLYTETEFDLYDYLLLIVTLLKHEEEMKAQEVLFDMYKNIEYGTYLDHVWDLDETDEKQKEFSKTVEECFDDINSVPTFFSWVYKAREKYEK